MKLKRIYMNEVDSSPGGGAVTPAQAAVPAQGAPVVASIPVEQAKAMFGEMLGEFRNGIFADLRKAGAFGKEKPAEATNAGTTASPAGISAADVKTMLERERVITRAATQHALNDAQLKRMNSALGADNPEDVSAWTSSYLTDMGLVKATAPVTQIAVTAATTAQALPVAAAPSALAHVDGLTQTGLPDLFNMSAAQIQSMGPASVRSAFEQVLTVGQQLNGAPPRPRIAARK